MGRRERRGGAFYDEPGVVDRYRAHRQWAENPNRMMEEPAVLEELGSVSGARVLDLGCGEADTGRLLLNAGVSSYLGVDGSARMTELARAGLTDRRAEVIRCDIESFTAAAGSFNLVVSRMALHYVANQEPATCGKLEAPLSIAFTFRACEPPLLVWRHPRWSYQQPVASRRIRHACAMRPADSCVT
jgi:SAM-dependent methyltransferase